MGYYTSLALDSSGNPRISYGVASNLDLKYAYNDGTDWHTESVDSAGDVGEYTSLALDSSGNPRISYRDVTNSDLKYAYLPPSPLSTWYLAEGTTAWGFSTYITIENPNTSAAGRTASPTCPQEARNVTETVTPPRSEPDHRHQRPPADKDGRTMDFSTKVECTDKTKPIAVDRTMSWTGHGAASPRGALLGGGDRPR